MSAVNGARRQRAPPFLDPPGYARHRPEATLLYRLVEQHYPAFRALRSAAGRPLPDYIEQEFDAYLKCGRFEEGFLRLRCEDCHAEKLVAFSCPSAAPGAPTGSGSVPVRVAARSAGTAVAGPPGLKPKVRGIFAGL